MTTNELKSYVDRILGDSVRVLLPSYWWKRAFGAVIDKVEEKIEKDDLKTVNGESILGEGDLKIGVKSVESVEALEKLNAELGDIATVGSESLKFVSVGSLYQYKEGDSFSALTPVKGVSISVPTTSIGDSSVVNLVDRYMGGGILALLCSADGADGYISVYYKDGTIKDLMRNKTLNEPNIEELNTYLKNNDVRYAANGTGSGYNSDFIDTWLKVEVPAILSDAYIKSKNWDKLAKEYTVSSEEELNGLDVPNGTIAKVCEETSLVKIADCYYTTNVDTISEDWDKLTIIKAVTEKGNPSPDGGSIYLLKTADGIDRGNFLLVGWDESGHAYGKYVNGTMSLITKDELNATLGSEDYRFVYGYHWGEIDSYFDFYKKITATADAYIKSDTWKRLLKEGDVTGGGINGANVEAVNDNGIIDDAFTYATESYVNTTFATKEEVIENELVHSSAYVDLDARLKKLESMLLTEATE